MYVIYSMLFGINLKNMLPYRTFKNTFYPFEAK